MRCSGLTLTSGGCSRCAGRFISPFFCFRQEALDEPAEELSGIHRCCMGLVYVTFPSQLGLGDVLGLKCAKLKDSSCHSQKMESSLEMGTDMGEHNGAGGVPSDVFFCFWCEITN